jgi:dTDP-4-dehydrorhamnose reductase
VDTLLVAGIDTVVGANLASSLSEDCRVVGLALSKPTTLSHCETAYCPHTDAETARKWLASIKPNRVVLCGPAAQSPWHTAFSPAPKTSDIETAEHWAYAASESNAEFTLVSSDALFTGPWLFHTEESNCLCDSSEARRIRQIEKTCLKACPESLVIRTNVFGWSSDRGWLEQTLDDLDAGIAGPFDFQRHASPMLATDFVESLQQAWIANLQGTYHIAGAERVNPNQFVNRLATEFGLPAPHPVDGNSLMERPVGFGCGETSLHTTKIRKSIGISMPTLAESLQRLREQRHNGYCDRLKTPVQHKKVA